MLAGSGLAAAASVAVRRPVRVTLTRDYGETADETVEFGIDGKSYEIDLSDANAAKLRDALAPYLGHARRTGGRRLRCAERQSRAQRRRGRLGLR